jgi:TRAP-type C4-dicarboxylate transport system substrate-binding protein
MDTFRAVGAHPTPMAFPELFTALQQGTVDGQENPITVIVSARFSEVQKFLSMTRHSYTSGALLVSNHLYSSLNDEEKSWFEAASKASVAATRENISNMEEEGLTLLKERGMQINDDLDYAALREKAEPVYQGFIKGYGSDLLDRIRKSECLAS